MKFLALVVSAIAAVQIKEGPVERIFHEVDTSNDGEIQPRELRTALQDYARSVNYRITRADRRWVRRAARTADADGSHSLDLPEFENFVRAFVRHYHINTTGDAQEDNVEAQLRAIFNHVDTSGDGEISADELETALRAFAAHENYTITPADEEWVERAAGRADRDDDDHLNFREFTHFVRAFVRHYHIQQ